jgi:hypothetical protein
MINLEGSWIFYQNVRIITKVRFDNSDAIRQAVLKNLPISPLSIFACLRLKIPSKRLVSFASEGSTSSGCVRFLLEEDSQP